MVVKSGRMGWVGVGGVSGGVRTGWWDGVMG